MPRRSQLSLRLLRFLIVFALGGIVFPVSTTTVAAEPLRFFVAPAGNDANPGTSDRPFATLSRARDAVRAHVARGLTSDVVVTIRGGHYRLEEPVVFEPQDSGDERYSITYAAQSGEEPAFSGGRKIDGWKRVGETWQAVVPDRKDGRWRFNQLFVDGKQRPRARDPNEGYHRIAAAGPDNRTSFRARPGDLRKLADASAAEVLFLHDWSVSRIVVSSIDADRNTVTLADAIGAGADFFRITGYEPHPRYRLENAVELLDEPGEWCLDAAGVLHYLPMPGEDPRRAEVVAPAVESLLNVRGQPRDGKHVRNLRFVGLTLTHAAAPHFPKGYAGIQAGFHDQRETDARVARRGRMPAAVVFKATENCRFEAGRIVDVGASAISIQGPAENNAVVGNEIAGAGGNGVMIGEPSTDPALTAKNNRVSNNRIHHCGATFFGCVGVWAGITEGTVVEHNEIHDLPYTGVSVGWVWNPTPSPCRDNRVERNHIHHVMQVLSDGGGIYTLGRQEGTVLRGNLIHDVPINAGRAESNGMFIDEGSSQLLIEKNVIYGTARSPIRFHRARENAIRDNVLVLPENTPPFRYNSTDESTMTFRGNLTPAAKSWTPPNAADVGAGFEPAYAEPFRGPK